jgi:Mn2+/Fe2+ NRAMP family transporter
LSETLILLLTVETLLIAVLAVAVSLSGPRPTGGRPFVVRGGLVVVIALAITVVAMGAGAAWVEGYADPGPSNAGQWMETVAVAVGILGGVIFSWGLWFARPK